MSIHDEITTHLMSGRLIRLRHGLTGVTVARVLILNRDVLAAVDPTRWSGNGLYRLGTLRADLDRFTGGDRVAVMLHPRPKPTAYLKRLEPTADEVWEIL